MTDLNWLVVVGEVEYGVHTRGLVRMRDRAHLAR